MRWGGVAPAVLLETWLEKTHALENQVTALEIVLSVLSPSIRFHSLYYHFTSIYHNTCSVVDTCTSTDHTCILSHYRETEWDRMRHNSIDIDFPYRRTAPRSLISTSPKPDGESMSAHGQVETTCFTQPSWLSSYSLGVSRGCRNPSARESVTTWRHWWSTTSWASQNVTRGCRQEQLNSRQWSHLGRKMSSHITGLKTVSEAQVPASPWWTGCSLG